MKSSTRSMPGAAYWPRPVARNELLSPGRVLEAMWLLVLVLAAVEVPSAAAQGIGYGVAGPAGVSGFFRSSASSVHAAGGGEFLFEGRAGVAGEFGVLANSSSVLTVVSANGVMHFSSSQAQGLSPFVTGGYTRLGNGDGSFDAWNVGVGVDIWMKDRAGLRLDFRDHVRPDSRGAVQYWTIRAGIAFR